MNRFEILSDVAPSEIHIDDRISAFKMLSGKILDLGRGQMGSNGLGRFVLAERVYRKMQSRFFPFKKGIELTVERSTLNAYIFYDI